MNIIRKSWILLGMAFILLVVVMLVGLVMLADLEEEMTEIGRPVPGFMQPFLAYHEAWQDSTGNELTGIATAVLFGASTVPVGVDLISRIMIRYVPFGERVKGIVRRINTIQKKFLMPFHTYLSILALGLGGVHLYLSYCAANPFPELGLVLSGLLVATGLLFKWKAIPSSFRKAFYQFHSSLIVTGVLLVVLFAGHAVMGLD